MTTPPKRLDDALREALANAPVSRYRIDADAGIDKAALCRFLHGQRSLSFNKACELAQYLNLELRPVKGSK